MSRLPFIYYAVTLRSDRGYVGVLAYNPVHSDYATVYPRSCLQW